MAFNPFISFQKNKRFWMAAILMICMVSFVFCTGMKGGMEELIPRWFGFGGRGATAVTIDGRNLSRRDLDELKAQRNLANNFMKNCAEFAYKNVVKRYADMHKDVENKEMDKRKENLALLLQMRSTLFARKSKDRYFDLGVKFDDLIEFKLWQLEADRLGIKIEENHLDELFFLEFFRAYGFLSIEEEVLALRDAQRGGDLRDASRGLVRKAVAEEFRVKIAQYALLGAQPFSFHIRRKAQRGEPKFVNFELPDEVRGPVSLAQLFDFYKAQQAKFSVTFVPVRAQDFLDQVKEPDEIEKAAFYNEHKNDPTDPGSDKWGMEIPPRARFEYLHADPMAPQYFELAKRLDQFRWNHLTIPNPAAFQLVESPLAGALAIGMIEQKHRETIEGHYKTEVGAVERYRAAAGFTDRDCLSPIAVYLASRHPQSVASLIASAARMPSDGLDSAAMFMAWGSVKYPLEVKSSAGEKGKEVIELADNKTEQDAAAHSEVARRKNLYKDFFLSSTSGFPLDVLCPYLAIEALGTIQDIEEAGGRINPEIKLEMMPRDVFVRHPRFTAQTVRQELEDMIAKQTAREWAQANIREAKEALDKKAGNRSNFNRELTELVLSLKLTHGPDDAKKLVYHDRFSVNEAPEFHLLKQEFLKYRLLINMYEGRESGTKRLKDEDFPRMLFDTTESFAAKAKFQPMPWPPEVRPDNTRDLDVAVNLTRGVDFADVQRFKNRLNEGDPYKAPEPLKLYLTADRPILFWRTDELPTPPRTGDYKKLLADIDALAAERASLEKKDQKDPAVLERLAIVKREQADLQYVTRRVTEGFKVKLARDDKALPAAEDIAKGLIGVKTELKLDRMRRDAGKLPGSAEVITLTQTLLEQEQVGNRRDYAPPSLPKEKVSFPRDLMAKDNPKDKLIYPREDMMPSILQLIDLKGPIVQGNTKLDEINKSLFDQGKDLKQFVQIIANKPRTVFYVASVTAAPRAEPVFFKFPMEAASIMAPNRDMLVDRAQEDAARLFRARFIEGLRVARNVNVVDADAKKSLDGDRE